MSKVMLAAFCLAQTEYIPRTRDFSFPALGDTLAVFQAYYSTHLIINSNFTDACVFHR
jgi:hypothetical protein